MTEPKSGKRIVLHGQAPDGVPSIEHSRQTGIQPHIFLLSPANGAGRRAKMLLNPDAAFDLAQRLRASGIALGESFSFMSSLYFRGKLSYAATFSRPVAVVPNTLIITSSRGLLRPETIVTLPELSAISCERIVDHNPQYRDPLERDLRKLSETIGQHSRVLLLGSIATRKYIPLLLEILGERLLVPRAFVGLGNMSRGSLLLQCVREKYELEYISVISAIPKAM
jgi:hypothetical protein